MIRFPLFLFFLIPLFTQAQLTNIESYDIKKADGKDCQSLHQKRSMMPADVRFTVIRVENERLLALYINDASWFEVIFSSKNDGFAIDLVSKELFACDNNVPFKSWSHKGYLMPPLYKGNFKDRLIIDEDGSGVIVYGEIPAHLAADNVEANIVFLDNRNFCGYQTIADLDMQGWDLLKTGMYMDTLTREEITDKYKEVYKTLHFTIPFEKNKTEYNPQDIKPLYDSLNISDYNIKKISIQAYTSVEGSYEKNVFLQNKRAESIVKALASYQDVAMESTVKASENWVEFMEDVSQSPYKNLTTLSKEEIKAQLSSNQMLTKLEPLLSRHRKAVIELQLEKKIALLNSNPDDLKKYFDQSIAHRNINEALYLQQIIFYKVTEKNLPDNFINTLEIPEASEFGRLLLNRAAFEYESGEYNEYEALKNFERLLTILPNNNKIQYNICALKLKIWTNGEALIDPVALKKEIEGLRKKGIHENLVKRLLINYHIILSEVHYRKRNYIEKDKSVKYIFDTYKALKLSDADLVNMAKYFSTYSKFDWATNILNARARSIDASEDLLFYYISLTITNPKLTSSSYYRTIMLNALNHNQPRFCELFNTMGYGGISFQLLADEKLKKTYCENCNQP